ncbi:MAG: hypothetical protein ACO3GX_16715 [Gemmataceae bacterium]
MGHFAPSKPGASLRSAPGYRILPRWGLENIAYAPTGHDGNGLFMFSGLGNMLTPASFLPQRGMMRKPRATP